MNRFETLTAVACPLPIAGLDTDQLLPARFMKRDRAQGYGSVLLHDLRVSPDGTSLGFSLDDPRYHGAQILVAHRNFGGGSSREAAVYALADYGIRCVIAPSFGDIFSSNCINNGVLPAIVSEQSAELLIARTSFRPEMTIDLRNLTIHAEDISVPFSVMDAWRERLLNGWEEIDLTLQRLDEITVFAADDAMRHPWARPAPVGPGKDVRTSQVIDK